MKPPGWDEAPGTVAPGWDAAPGVDAAPRMVAPGWDAAPRVDEAPVVVARGSQPVHAERVLCGGVGEDHVGVVEHVKSIQGQRVNFEFIQRELGIRVEADVPHSCQGAGQFF